MRADRLVAILLMLQRRGSVTANDVASELEISERTARRDLEALGAAGLPVYSQQGRNGGWRLLGQGSTDLTGLTAAEVRALFLVAGPAAGATKDVKAALRKLVGALPEPFRDQAETASSAIVVDPAGWNSTAPERPAPTWLDQVQEAVVTSSQIEIAYVARDRASTTRVVHPLGLAAKGAVWYLVANTGAGLRTFRIDRIRSVNPTGDPVVRPPGFVLADAWALITEQVNERRMPERVRFRTDLPTSRVLVRLFGSRLSVGAIDPPAETEAPRLNTSSMHTSMLASPRDRPMVEAELVGWNLEVLACELAGFADAVEVIEPVEVRRHLGEIGAKLIRRYGGPSDAELGH